MNLIPRLRNTCSAPVTSVPAWNHRTSVWTPCQIAGADTCTYQGFSQNKRGVALRGWRAMVARRPTTYVHICQSNVEPKQGHNYTSIDTRKESLEFTEKASA